MISLYVLTLCIVFTNSEYILQQVVILSRHNVRTPLSKNLGFMSPKPWPVWKEKKGHLTAKGAQLEGFMGEYFSLWLRNEGLLPDTCPRDDLFYIYANTAQRTMASAQAFIDKGFPNCNITVHHKQNTDPIFDPVVHNSSIQFQQEALDEMHNHLNLLALNNSYTHLEDILDYKKSNFCEIYSKCDLVLDKNQPFIQVGTKPYISGPLKISKSAIDSFIMENYEGFPLKEVAWGHLKDTEDWNKIIDLSRSYHDVIFNTTLVSKDLSRPLVNYVKDLLLSKNTSKVVVIMGHDANLYTLLNAMNFKPYTLEGQFEKVPAGGKIVFQKWLSIKNKNYYIKINYVYQNTEGMRKATKLSVINPPNFTILELKQCNVDDNGFCLWNDFVKFLNSL